VTGVTAAQHVDQAPLLQVRDLRVTSMLAGRRRSILGGIDVDVQVGETLGIVGESGSGKSVFARAVAGLLASGLHAEGDIRYRGRDLLSLAERERKSLRGRNIGMLFQDPFSMLNPLQRCGDHVVELLRDERGRRPPREVRRQAAVRLLEEVGIDDEHVVDAFPHELSGGMRQRVGIAAVLAGDPDLLIADEPTTALDVTTQRDILVRLRELQRARGMGLVLITHDLRVGFSLCDRITVLYGGSVLERGPASAMYADPRHPYTLGLLTSEPPTDRRVARLRAIDGTVPDADEVLHECGFAARCQWSAPQCVSGKPVLTPVGERRTAHLGVHDSACVRIGDVIGEMRSVRGAADAAPERSPLAGEELVNAEELGKTFTARHRRVTALDAVSFELRANEIVGIVGESGSGKTTLGRVVVGLETPTAGRLHVGGVDASNVERMAPDRRRKLRRFVQMVFQDPSATLNPMLTVGATLSEAVSAHERVGRQEARARVAALLQDVGLSDTYASRKPVALSGGERQRVAIARALAARPRVLVCDEAVSALDVSVQAQIVNLLLRLRLQHGLSLIFITHDLAVVRQVADRVYVLRKGVVVEQGATADVLDRPAHPYTRDLVAATPSADRSWLADSTAELVGGGPST
jgi:peptide/nickel transport system ATP-binding protein